MLFDEHYITRNLMHFQTYLTLKHSTYLSTYHAAE